MSADYTDDEEESDSEKEKGEGGRRSGGGGGGGVRPQQSAPSISAVALAVTQAKGASATTIGRIVGEWKHLTGADLVKSLAAFGNGITRASAHLTVSWVDKGFATVMTFLQVITQAQSSQLRAAMMRDANPQAKSDFG